MPRALKYGQVILEHQRNIGDDELVVVFRAKDENVPGMLRFYQEQCITGGSPQNHIELLEGLITAVLDWQAENGSQTPGSPGLTYQDVFGG